MPATPFETVDVFTGTRFGGNPLAVVTDARGLSDPLMQRIAAEFGYSETTFVLPPDDPAHTARVRIFTPTTEVPFAGHPNVGTAFVLARRGAVFERPVTDTMTFEEPAGLVAVAVERGAGGEVEGAMITAPAPLTVGDEVSLELVAACASLEVADIALTAHPPRVVSVGLPFVVAELTGRSALARARPSAAHFAAPEAAQLEMVGGLALFLYAATPGAATDYSARMFVPLDGVAEDPATGSAAAALAAYRAALSPAPDAHTHLLIEQGVDMGRLSAIRAQVQKAGGVIRRVSVGGSCVPVMRGELLP